MRLDFIIIPVVAGLASALVHTSESLLARQTRLSPLTSILLRNAYRSQSATSRSRVVSAVVPSFSSRVMVDETDETSGMGASASESKQWATRALLISSFADGVERSPPASAYLRKSLIERLSKDFVRLKEADVRDSVVFSPCNGVNMDALDALDNADAIIASARLPAVADDHEAETRQLDLLSNLVSANRGQPLQLRFLYIPTAMYALRSDSTRSPGKQRQAARYDGKQRRKAVVRHLEELLGGPEKVAILAATLDLDDGSVKQPQGSDKVSDFPSDGRSALEEWRPHLVYVEGGNTFWLAHCLEKGEWGDTLVNAITGTNAAVYVGKSAGAIIAGSAIETACWKGWDDPSVVPERPSYEDWLGLEGMKLAGDSAFFPHMDEIWEETVAEKVKELREREKKSLSVRANSVICLHNSVACCIDGANKILTLVGE